MSQRLDSGGFILPRPEVLSRRARRTVIALAAWSSGKECELTV